MEGIEGEKFPQHFSFPILPVSGIKKSRRAVMRGGFFRLGQ